MLKHGSPLVIEGHPFCFGITGAPASLRDALASFRYIVP